MTVIVFIGSVFSPYYVIAREAARTAQQGADPREHVAVNVALYGARGSVWTMTERNAGALQTAADGLRIGPSALVWRDGVLRITIDERAAPLPRRVRGVITLRPGVFFDATVPIDVAGRHRWSPLAPCARADIDFRSPAMRWSGHAYLDSNEGDGPLEEDFASWEWSRARLPDGATAVLYDATRRDGSRLALAESFHPDGTRARFAMPPRQALSPGLWRMPRTTHGDAPRLVRALEDGPFYTRSIVTTRLGGTDVTAMHESLSLDRFRRRWVQSLLPFRMPR